MEDHGRRFHHQLRQQHERLQHPPQGTIKKNLKEGLSKAKQFFKKPEVQIACMVVGSVVLVGCAVAAGLCLFREDQTMNEWVNSIIRGL
jgi:hypothetical protein